MRTRSSVVALSVLVSGALLGCGSASTPSSGSAADDSGDITVFAAASLTEPFTAIGAQFEADHPGSTVTFSFAGSSGLATQITNGAPADVFAAASTTAMDQVLASGSQPSRPRSRATRWPSRCHLATRARSPRWPI